MNDKPFWPAKKRQALNTFGTHMVPQEGFTLSYTVETRGLEEHQHPFYIIRYVVKKGDEEILTSVARYVHGKNGGKVQFLEPDLRRIQAWPNGIEHLNEIERTVKKEGNRLVDQLKQ
jgi:hypothetical protein